MTTNVLRGYVVGVGVLVVSVALIVTIMDLDEGLIAFVVVGALIAALIDALHRSRRAAIANAERSRSADERFMRAFFTSPTPQAITRLADQTMVEVNAAYLTTFGVTREQIIDKDPIQAGLKIELLAELSEQLNVEKHLDCVDVKVTTAGGRELSLLASSHMIEIDGQKMVLSSMIDVTDRVAAQNEARTLAQRFEQLSIAIRGEVFWLMDIRAHQILYVSDAFEEIWGRPCSSMYESADAWLEAIHPDDRERAATAFAKLDDYNETFRIVQPSGAIRWINDRCFPIRDEKGEVIRVAGVSTDVTERRQLEDQVRQAQKLESVGRLAGGIAHDFNNLLNVIVANTDLLREELLLASQREMLDEVDAAVSRAAALTRQLLAFSRKQPTEAIVLDINRVVEDTRRMLRRLVGDDITIRVSLDPEAGRIRCDPSQLVQILMNLAVNARDAMGGRGGTVHIETRTEGPDVVIAIIDNGCGMPPEVVARVFEPFFTTKEVGKGTGLGLAVVHGIVEQAAGSIAVESAIGVGTTFTVRFPRVADQADAVTNLVAASSRGTERILLVDDDWHVRSSAARALRSRGYTVYEAENGRAALRVLDERPIDILVTDVVMPGMDGRRLFEAAHLRMPDLPVLFMSGYTDDEVVHRGVRAAELAFLEKPFRVHALAAKVRQVLDENHA
jgi:two-component system cell cycle sensor histidine kinase/response regulator CckA